MNLNEIMKELFQIKEYDVLIFGSFLKGEWREDSDIDIAVLSHDCDMMVNKKLKQSLLGKVPSKYDITIFESLPSVIKASILQNYEIIFGDPLEIGEYLRRYWKEWQDYEHRLELPSLDEMRVNISR
ncbi:MAG: nucleotidyltransferase domain-containing protein [Candidatus Thorarchaeota archaeon]|nr:MAG: nucleotidyltransferase domain-containing protein [Candidatus Thorarchaeota archaeon]